jgi:protein-tyrosine-phosphatase
VKKISTTSFIIFFWSQGLAQIPITTVVFVCEHGGARSTIASAYFNKMVEENHLPYHSIFRGLTPDSVITKETDRGLKADGFDTRTFKTTALTPKDISTNTMFISLDCAVPESYPTYRTWKNIPTISENYIAARNEILKKLNDLVTELKNKK